VNLSRTPRVVSALRYHVVALYPSKNILVKEAEDDEIERVVYEPTGSVIDSDDDVKISSIQ